MRIDAIGVATVGDDFSTRLQISGDALQLMQCDILCAGYVAQYTVICRPDIIDRDRSFGNARGQIITADRFGHVCAIR